MFPDGDMEVNEAGVNGIAGRSKMVRLMCVPLIDVNQESTRLLEIRQLLILSGNSKWTRYFGLV